MTINPHEIEFRNPPSTTSRIPGTLAHQAAEFVRVISSRPGEWAVFRTGMVAGNAYATASQYRKRFPETEWIARRDLDDQFSLFVRVLPF